MLNGAENFLRLARRLKQPWPLLYALIAVPPPLRNFDRIPRIRSERPAFDLHYPDHMPGHSLQHPPAGGAKPLSGESDGGATYQDH